MNIPIVGDNIVDKMSPNTSPHLACGHTITISPDIQEWLLLDTQVI